MKKPKFFIFAVLLVFAGSSVFAQTAEENNIQPSYEILLQVVVASNDRSEKAKFPPALTGVIAKLKNDYSFANYSLAATFLERISATGIIEHKGILNQLKQANDEKMYFSEWGLSGLKSGTDEKGKNLVHFQTFNFGARVPVVAGVTGQGDAREIINYESIGVRISRFNLPENTPTIIGSLATQKTDEFIFLVLTVRPV